MSSDVIIARLLNFLVLVLSLTVHEFFHAWSAWKLGDDTAARMGRLTLNPIPHIDLIGTVILPLVGAPIGWAKPVPVDPARFRRGVRMSTGDILVSVAGPLSNLGLALVCAAILGVLVRFFPGLAFGDGIAGSSLLAAMIFMNVGLAIFNILPVPPLDGSHVLGNLLPYRWRDAWARFATFAPMLLLLLLVAERQTGQPLISAVLGPPRSLLLSVLQPLAGIRLF